MTLTNWTGGSADWNDPTHWDDGVPNGTSFDASLGGASSYTVTLAGSEQFSIKSLSISNSLATLAVDGSLTLEDGLTFTHGSVGGTGTLTLADGAATLGAGVSLTVANVSVEFADVSLGGNLSYANHWSQTDGSVDLGGHTLTLSGATSLSSGAVIGSSGTLATSGKSISIFNGWTLGGAVALNNTGTIDQTGSSVIGDSGSSTATLTNQATGTYQLDGDFTTFHNGAGSIANAGLFEKVTGTGSDFIDPNFTNTGTVTAETGTIEFDGATTGISGTVSGAGTVTFDGAATTINAGAHLTVANVVVRFTDLSLGGNLSYAGDWTQSAGTIDLGGHTLSLTGPTTLSEGSVIGSSGTLATSGKSIALSDGWTLGGAATLNNTGTIDQTGSTTIGDSGTSTATLTNEAGGTYDLDGDFTIFHSGAGAIVNAGAFNSAAGAGSDFVDPNFTNTGSVLVTSGTLEFDGATTSLSGTMSGAGTLALGGAAATINAGAKLTVANLVFADGAVTIAPTASVTAATNVLVQFATVKLGGNLSNTGGWSQTDGSVDLGGHTLTLSGATSLSSGAVIGSSGTLATSGKSISIFNGWTLGGAVALNNTGTIDQTGSSVIGDSGSSTATLTNQATGTYQLDGDFTTFHNGAGSIANAGLFEKVTGTGSDFIDPNFTNTGTVTAETGTIEFDGATTGISGTVSGAGTVTFDGAATTINAGAHLTVANVVVRFTDLSLGGNLSYAGDWTQSAGTIDLGGHTLSLTGPTTLSEGSVIGSSGTLATSGKSIALSDGWTLGGAATLNNTGTIDQTGSTTIGDSGTSTATLTNEAGGTYDLDGDFTIFHSGAGAIVNAGAFNSAAGAGSDFVDPNFTNTGSVLVTSGTLEFDGAFSNSGGVTASGGGIAYIASTNFANFSGTTLTGGSYQADANSTVRLPNGAEIVTDDANITLSGAGSDVQAMVDNAAVSLEDTLTTIGAAGALHVLASRDFTTTAAFSNAGTFEIGGGDFTAAFLANSGSVVGFGKITPSVQSTGVITAAGGVLEFDGAANRFAGTADGSGTALLTHATTLTGLTIGGSLTLENNGTVTQTGQVTLGDKTALAATFRNLAGAVYNIAGASGISSGTSSASAFVNAGLLQKTSGTGTSTIAADVVDTSKITVKTGTLALTGPVNSFAGTLNGPGRLVLGGASTFGLVTIGGALTATNTGTVSLTAQLTVGDATTTAASFVNAAGATFDVVNASGVGHGAAAGSSFVNAGTLAKTAGAGVSLIAVSFTDTGSIAIASGSLAFSGAATFAGAITGAGTLSFAGGDQTLNAGTKLGTATWALSGGATTTIDEVLSYAGGFAEAEGTSLSIASGDELAFSGPAATFGGAVSGAGTLSFAGGSQTLSVTSITAADWALSNNSATTLSEVLTYAGGFTETGAKTDLDIASGAKLTLTGAASFGGAVSGAGTLSLTAGAQTLASGATLGVAHWSLAGADTTTVDDTLSYAGAFTGGAKTTLSISSGDALTFTAAATFAGAVNGAGTLNFTGGSQTLSGVASLAVANWALSNSAATTLNETLSYAGSFSESGAETTLGISSGDALTFTAAATFAGAVNGAGTLSFTGGSQTLNNNTSLGVAIWALSNNAATTLNETLSYAGSFSESGAKTTLSISSGETLTFTAAATFAGIVGGSGTLSFAGGNQTLSGGTTLGVANWGLSNGAATVLNETLSYSGAFTGGDKTTLSIASGDVLTFAGPATFAGAVNGAGTLTFAGGSQTFSGVATLGVTTWSLSNKDATAVDQTLAYAGAFTEGAMAAVSIAAGDTLKLTGAAALGGTVSGAGTLSLGGKSDTLQAGVTLSVAKVAIAGAAAKVSLGANLSYAHALSQSGGVLALGAHTLTLTGAGSTFAGSITGAGTLSFAGGSQALSGKASLGVTHWSISGLDTTTVAETLSYAGAFTAAAKTKLSIASGDTLTFTGGGATFAGMVNGPGTLSFAGASQTLNTGAQLGVANWSVNGAGTTAVDESLTYTGNFSEGGGAKLNIASGDTLALGGATLAGTVGGLGTLNFAAGSQTLNSGTSLLVSAVTLASAADVTLGADLSYSGAWTQTGGTVDVGANTLSLSGPASFGPGAAVVGVEALTLGGATSITGLTIGGSVDVGNQGTIDDAGALTIGDGTNAAATLTNAAAGVFDLDGNVSIARGAASGSRFINDGAVIKDAGGGVSVVGVTFTNAGTVEVISGGLKFGAGVNGAGTTTLDAGTTLEFAGAVSSGQEIAFAGSGASLQIDVASSFAGAVSGFAATDAINLAKFAFSGAEQVGFVENAAGKGGVLTVTDGAQHIGIALLGQYAAAGFGLSNDGHGATEISYTPPPASIALALAHT